MTLSKKIIEIIKSLLITFILTFVLLLILALCVYLWDLNSTITNLLIILIYIFTCFLGGFYLGKQVKHRSFLWGCALGICYISLILFAGILFEHPFSVNQTTITTALLCLGGGTLGGMVS